MSQAADTATASTPSPARNGEGALDLERTLSWFDDVVWCEPHICSHCFARLKQSHSGEVATPAGKLIDVDEQWRTDSATLEHGHDPLPDPPQTTCLECGSMGGVAAYDTLSEAAMVDRVPALVDRVEEAGHQINVGTVYDVVRDLATTERYASADKEIFAVAAALGVEKA